jgi:predicted phosphohydrolase
MRFQILSDLHLEFFSSRDSKIEFLESLKTDADYVLLAGDISTGKNIVQDYNLVGDVLGNIIYIAGNHEYYHSSKFYIDGLLQHEVEGLFLNDNYVIIDDVAIVGGTG